MSRWEFMRQLEELLSDISPSEREEALQYYNDYFNDAGRENEAEVIKALGTPQQVAKIVKDGINGVDSLGEFTENGFFSGTDPDRKAVIKRPTGTNAGQTHDQASDNMAGDRQAQSSKAESYQAGGGQSHNADKDENEFKRAYENMKRDIASLPTWAEVLIIIGIIICAPFVLIAAGTVVVTIAGVIISVVSTVISFIFGIAVAAVVLLVVTVFLIGMGISCLVYEPVAAIGLFGAALICAGIGLLFLLFTVFLIVKGIPALCQGISYLWEKCFSKKGGAQA